MKNRKWIAVLCASLLLGCTSVSKETETQNTEVPTATETPTVEVAPTETPSSVTVEANEETPQPMIETISVTMDIEGDVVSFSAYPSLSEFERLVEGNLSDPKVTCALFLCGLNLFVQDRDQGVEAINILKGPQPLSTADINWYRDRLMDKEYLPNVYFEGATPENNYTPNEPLKIQFYEDPSPQYTEEGYMKLYVKAPAFDSPRAFTLREKDGNWYIWNISSIMVGVRTPAKDDPWKS